MAIRPTVPRGKSSEQRIRIPVVLRSTSSPAKRVPAPRNPMGILAEGLNLFERLPATSGVEWTYGKDAGTPCEHGSVAATEYLRREPKPVSDRTSIVGWSVRILLRPRDRIAILRGKTTTPSPDLSRRARQSVPGRAALSG
jgi:hypothetical protein